MEELFEKIKKEAKEIIKKQQYIEGIKKMLVKSQNVIKNLLYERNKIQDKDSTEYQLICFKIEKEEQQRKEIYEEWINQNKQLEKKIKESKQEILEQIKYKSYLIYNNITFGNLKIKDIEREDIKTLEQEKKELQIKINLAKISDEDIEKSHIEQQDEVYEARKNLNNYLERIREIDEIIQLYYLIRNKEAIDILRQLQQIKKQIEEKFNKEYIKEINDIEHLESKKEKDEEDEKEKQTQDEKDKEQEKTQKNQLKEKQKTTMEKIQQLQQEWEKWHEYYNKSYTLKKLKQKRKNKDFLELAQEVLKRKMERTQEEYYILQYELNYKKVEEVKENNSRSIKEKIANITMADIVAVNEKSKKKQEKNKELYDKDDKIINGILAELDDLYKKQIEQTVPKKHNTNFRVFTNNILKNKRNKKEKKDKIDDNKKFREEQKYNMTQDDIESVKSLTEIWKNKLLNETIQNQEQGDNSNQK